MKVIEALKREKPTLSFEFFPPKTEPQEKHLFEVIAELKRYNPDFVSVTCGALGTTREKTTFWVKEIKEKFQIEPVAHLTCVAESRYRIREHLAELAFVGAKNILALRGDPPAGHARFVPALNGFRNARDLIAFIKKENPDFCLGAAGYPEGHRESPTLEKDIEFLKQKVDAGAEYIITQLFFESGHYFRFLENCQKAGITVPILPGIMPITSVKQIKKMTEICGATIPPALLEKLEKYESDPKAVLEIGIETTIDLCKKLKNSNPPGFHFFVMNQAEAVGKVLNSLE